MGMTGSSDTGIEDRSFLGVSGYGAIVKLIEVHQSCFPPQSVFLPPVEVASLVLSVLSMTLDVLRFLCGIYHAAFRCTGSRRLISLMLLGSQTELAYIYHTGLTTALQALKRSQSSGFSLSHIPFPSHS